MTTLSIIGAGKVGTALARTIAAHGGRIAAVYSRTRAHAEALAHETSSTVVALPAEAIAAADLTLLTVPDDAIAPLAYELADTLATAYATSDLRTARAVIHTSGARSLDDLRSLAALGYMTGSLHPAYPFAHTNIAPDALRGVTFAIESDNARLSQWLHEMVAAVGGRALALQPDDKALYHAALVLTSNYAVSLFAASRVILTGLGAEADAADGALLSLLGGTLDNLRARGIPDALTGPLVRGDTGTIAAHLAALDALPDVKAAYLALARLSLPLLAARGVNMTPMEYLLRRSFF